MYANADSMPFQTFQQIRRMVEGAASVVVRGPVRGGMEAETGHPPSRRDIEEPWTAFVG